jgi:ribosomal protein S18 acetylase RimI-like enzyme
MENGTIRRANLSDAEAMSSLLAESHRYTYANLFSHDYIEKMIKDYYNVERLREEVMFINSQWHGYYVAEQNKKIVGVIAGGMINDTEAEIYVLYLAPTMRGKGIGSRLLDFYTKIQKYTYGATEQWVSVAKGNNFGIPFYKARNFIYQYEELSYGTVKSDQDISLKFVRTI